MTSVFIAGKPADNALYRTVAGMLGQYLPTITVWQQQLGVPSGAASLLVSDIRSFVSAQSHNTIIIFKDMQKIQFELLGEGQTIAVVDSQNKELIDFVSETKLPAITCGLSPKDTITLSSIDVDSAVINLQRNLTCFDDTVAESQEIPVRLCGLCDNFSLMAAASVFILSGNIDILANSALSFDANQ